MKITMLAVSLALIATTTVASELTLFEHDNFNGRRFTVRDVVNNLGDAGFNDRASSVVVGRGTWQLCDDAYFRGNCVTLQPGQYPSLRGCLKSLGCREPTQHQTRHGEVNHCLTALGQSFIVLAQTARLVEPRQGTFDVSTTILLS